MLIVCLDIICATSPPRQRGYVIDSGISHLESVRTVRCATGYEGTAINITCLSDGTWSQSDGCTTITADCESELVTTKVSSVSIDSCGGICIPTIEGTTCQCSPGFQSSSSPENSCVHD